MSKKTRYYPKCKCEEECDFEYLGNSDYGGYPVQCKTHGTILGLGVDPCDIDNCCKNKR